MCTRVINILVLAGIEQLMTYGRSVVFSNFLCQ